MITGAIGIFGVAVGAGLTHWLSHIAERRQEKLRQRAARRLICSDLHKARALLRQVRETGQWGEEKTPFPLDSYYAHAFVLAQHLPPVVWKRIEGAVLGIQHLELIREETQDNGRELDGADMQHITRIAAYVDVTIEAVDDEQWAIDRSDGHHDRPLFGERWNESHDE